MEAREITIETPRLEPVHESIVAVAPAATYEKRIARARALAWARGLTHLFVYGDREHFANIHYFTGYDPRFEEGLLVLSEAARPAILVGNEGYAYSALIPYGIDRVLYQTLSLPDQPRGEANRDALPAAIRKLGVTKSSRVGAVGWKYFVEEDGRDYGRMIDLPCFLIEALCEFVPRENVLNATDLMIHPEHGMRTELDIDEMAVLELAGTKSSRSVYEVLSRLKPGMSEIEASSYLGIDGDPVVAHPNVNFTMEGVAMGLASAGGARLEMGGVCNVGFGYRSSMVARTGIYARGKGDFPAKWADALEKVYKPYFELVALWYEMLDIGATGKAMVREIRKRIREYDDLNFGLNLGHLIHNDEWTCSIFTEKREYPVRSGMGIQCDIIAQPRGYPGAHVEDGLLVADAAARAAFKAKYPAAWGRIERRRRLVKDEIGIAIADSILPCSDIQACFFPFMASLNTVLGKR
jgi:hypothetical protein